MGDVTEPPVPTPPGPVRHTVTVRNAAVTSDNRIHEDSTARRFGFRGGLVPGVTLHGHMATAVYRAFGRDWVERGTLATRFSSPVYDGEEVTVTADPRPGASVPTLDVSLLNPAGEVCATAVATLPPVAVPAPDPDTVPRRPPPAVRPPADETSLAAGTVLGRLGPDRLWAARAPFYERYCSSDAGADEDLEDPGVMIVDANTALGSAVRLGPWIHVGSEVTHHAGVAAGAPIEVRSRVADNYERRGHRFVVLEVLWVNGGAVALSALHTAIYRLRGEPPVGAAGADPP